jgi:hypothetical protein
MRAQVGRQTDQELKSGPGARTICRPMVWHEDAQDRFSFESSVSAHPARVGMNREEEKKALVTKKACVTETLDLLQSRH